MTATAYIGLGANLNDPIDQLCTALTALSQLPGSRLLGISSLYGSKPLGPQDQPDFFNAVAALQTELEPLALLDALQSQEQEQGRVRRRHWGERCIDLDILLLGDTQWYCPRLTLPHKELTQRSFTLIPLAELDPHLCLPDGRRVSQLTPAFDGELQRCQHSGFEACCQRLLAG
ncbi:2-amino-4-hydroxy-6-hydroxymethyldihydropteridine diphosphokinase [Bacterioplanes sanyensis]|uniref:2-amino-4-hydroxy-6-hydroxymethyldihydropteridine pyrophosphokinase n=1 Tax=Bacterioplanes sanyensis TaxID=1249553 RepID=A0A222FQM1_9GAMM|nr:2-amino-4-hydroxy-6-hydroxymethyldihydropteridine diphosphokinase [Bacterioplanes sanyensis]ASP40701.1 2-amino-4-hydroxy-6-hydroxymethyldihydropteridine diphosphokinase [Bacterioplanes sanyensis]